MNDIWILMGNVLPHSIFVAHAKMVIYHYWQAAASPEELELSASSTACPWSTGTWCHPWRAVGWGGKQFVFCSWAPPITACTCISNIIMFACCRLSPVCSQLQQNNCSTLHINHISWTSLFFSKREHEVIMLDITNKWIFYGHLSVTLLKSLTGSYPVERAQSLVDTLLMSPSFSEAVARAAVSSGFPVCRTQKNI